MKSKIENKALKQEIKKLNDWINAKDEETQHDFAMEGINQIYWKGFLDGLKKALKLIKKDGK